MEICFIFCILFIDKSQFDVDLGYSQQAEIVLSVIGGNEWFLRKGSPFPMLATELFIEKCKGKDTLNK